MKTVGIIGGLGPETTSKFYLEVIFKCFEKDKLNRPPMLIWNVPLPYDIEERFITKAEGEEEYITFLIDAAKRLEAGGANFIVVPCNSVHIFIDDIRKAVSIPALSIVEETTNFLKEKQISEVGILATSATLQSRLYGKKFEQQNITVKTPNKKDQDNMGEVINNLVHSRQNDQDKLELTKIIRNFADKNIKTILLACTDLQLITPEVDDTEIYDTMKILVDATVREITK
jgi:aspartate racemase